jgi:hypothetical protein
MKLNYDCEDSVRKLILQGSAGQPMQPQNKSAATQVHQGNMVGIERTQLVPEAEAGPSNVMLNDPTRKPAAASSRQLAADVANTVAAAVTQQALNPLNSANPAAGGVMASKAAMQEMKATAREARMVAAEASRSKAAAPTVFKVVAAAPELSSGTANLAATTIAIAGPSGIAAQEADAANAGTASQRRQKSVAPHAVIMAAAPTEVATAGPQPKRSAAAGYDTAAAAAVVQSSQAGIITPGRITRAAASAAFASGVPVLVQAASPKANAKEKDVGPATAGNAGGSHQVGVVMVG